MAIDPKQAGHSVVSVRNSGRRGQRAGTQLEPERLGGVDVDEDDVDGVGGAGKPGVEDMAPIVAEPRRARASLRDWGTKDGRVEKIRSR